jgi:hypothetical protein
MLDPSSLLDRTALLQIVDSVREGIIRDILFATRSIGATLPKLRPGDTLLVSPFI